MKFKHIYENEMMCRCEDEKNNPLINLSAHPHIRISAHQFIILILSCFISTFAIAQNALHGEITDAGSGQYVLGAIVSIPQLKLGATTDSLGHYYITPLPKGSYTVEVRLLSYATITKQVTINGLTTLNFSLNSSSTTTHEVVITALGNITNTQRAPIPVTMVPHETLVEESSTNIVDAIAKQPGITAITTGPGVSKPEIEGLGYNRVLTVLDGERQEDFQWGDEHGVLIDPNAVYDVEIIKGPASLEYGANAMAGVVSFKSQPFPESGITQGSLNSEYQTNNGLISNSVDVGGNNKGFVWDFRLSNEDAHCYWDPKDNYVWGTAYTQSNARAVVGLNEKWGYSRLTLTALHKQIEIPDGNRDSASGAFEFDIPQTIPGQGPPQYDANGVLVPGTGKVYPTSSNFLSYNPNISGYQVLDHDELWWQNSINVGNHARVLGDIGYTMSHRQEIDSGTIAAENMTVHDIPYSFKYQVEGDSSGLKLTTGINGIYEWNTNAAEPPSPYVGDFEIPNYTDFDLGAYAILEKDYKNLTVSGGLRYDYRTMVGQPMYLGNAGTAEQFVEPSGTTAETPGATLQFGNFNRTFNGWSGSLGATYQLPENYYIKLNESRSYRAPSISELTSNELDPANIFRLGDPNLPAEYGYQTDVAFGHNGANISFEVDGFYNYINDFIFPQRIAAANGTDSIDNGGIVYKFTGGYTAVIAGVEGYLNIHPSGLKWIEMDNGFTYISTSLLHQADSTDHVPWTPAPRLTTEFKFKLANKDNSLLRNSYIKVGVEYDWAQNNIYSADYNELPSAAYALLNAGIGTSFVNKKTKRVVCKLIVNCTNLANIAYIDHTSRVQYFWAYNGAYAGPANYGVTAAVVTKPSEGIYNMGRNVGFKLVFPIFTHKGT